MSHECHKGNAPKELKFTILTISDTRTKETDDTGKFICDSLKKAGHQVVHYEIVKDDLDSIKSTVMEMGKDADIVITNGGTG
ncbi:MAG: molybdenum cofactor biosynthesis protein, partial [Thermoplasmata archaeon]|nr:molybdenum cofactor biosynthesis protein [Thermoplasmata archaeon]